MFGDMLRVGHPEPSITEQDGAEVLVVLAAERPDAAWMHWLSDVSPASANDLRILMSLHRLVQQWWVDATDLAPHLQVTRPEAEQAILRLRELEIGDSRLTSDVEGVPDRRLVLGLTDAAWERLVRLSDREGRVRRPPTRESVALSYSRHTGRLSTTELGSIVGAHSTNVGGVLRGLERQGRLAPSRTTRRGAGFFYRYVQDPSGPFSLD